MKGHTEFPVADEAPETISWLFCINKKRDNRHLRMKQTNLSATIIFLFLKGNYQIGSISLRGTDPWIELSVDPCASRPITIGFSFLAQASNRRAADNTFS